MLLLAVALSFRQDSATLRERDHYSVYTVWLLNTSGILIARREEFSQRAKIQGKLGEFPSDGY